MLPIVRLNRLAFRATNLAASRLDALLPAASQQQPGANNTNLAENTNLALLNSKPESQQHQKTLSELIQELREKGNQDKLTSFENAQKEAEGIIVGESSLSSQLSFADIQQASQLANFTNSMITQLYHLGVQDRTLWLQLKSVALRCAPYSSSLALVNTLECLARKAVVGPLECKTFQLQLGRDISALPAMEILRFIASCQLAGCPLQQNVKDVVSEQAQSWIQNTQANCSMWWVVADVLDQLPPSTRKALVTSLVFTVEQIRSSNYSNNNVTSSEAAEKRLKTLWPQHDKDTSFILWRLRSKGMFCLQTYLESSDSFNEENNNTSASDSAFYNPSYSDALLQSIRVDKLPSARSALFLLKALCLGREDLTEVGKVVAEDVCRLIYNNVIDNRIQSYQVLRTIIHSISTHEQIRTKVETAPLLGIDCSLLYLKFHSHHMSSDIACSILKICASLFSSSSSSTTTIISLDQVKSKLQNSLRRLLLISTSSSEIQQLVTLADRIEILDVNTAQFALYLLNTSQRAMPDEARKVSMIVQRLESKNQPESIITTKSKIAESFDNSSSSLVSNWSEIKALSSPKIAFYAANAARNLFAPSADSIASNNSVFAGSTVVSPISNLVSSHQQQSISSSTSTSQQQQQQSSASVMDGGLFGLCSAESEIVTNHKGLRALSANDCATLIGSTSLLPPEAKSLVLRMDSNKSLLQQQNLFQRNNKAFKDHETIHQQRILKRLKSGEQKEESQKVETGIKSTTTTTAAHSANPLFLQLKSTTRFLEAQSSVNTTLELNAGADTAIFVSAQRRLAQLLQFAHPPPFEFVNDSEWIEWCGRLVSAIAIHRLTTFRLPLWLANAFTCHYCATSSSSLTPFRAIRALHACCYFGIDNRDAIDSLLKNFVGSEALVDKSISARAVFQILKSLLHVASENSCKHFNDKIATVFVKDQLELFTIKLNEAKKIEANKKSATTVNSQAQLQQQQEPKAQEKKQVVSALHPSQFKSGFSTSSSTSSSITTPSYFTVAEKRSLFDVLCCSAHLDLPPLEFKHLIEHLHPFDTTLYPLADSIFFFGHAAQKKRLSGFSLRVWRTLTMQLDKVTLSTSETLSSASASSQSQQLQQDGSMMLSSNSGSSCGVPLIQTSMIVPPTLLSIAYYVANGGGSSACDSVLDKLKRLGPFEPLLLAKVIRIALAPPGLKTRPALSQFICRAFDSTVAESFSSNDLVKVMEVFHTNQAQRVAVGLIQADATVTLAWEALYQRLDSVEDDLFLRAAIIPCSSSLPSKFVTKILARLISMAKDDEKEIARASGAITEPIAVRDRFVWTPIIFQCVVSHVANVRNFHTAKGKEENAVDKEVLEEEEDEMENAAEFWEDIKRYLLEPLAPHLRGADKEAITELMLL